MKLRKLVVTVAKVMVVVLVATALNGVVSAQAAALPNQITVRSQDISNGILMVDSVTASQNGWIVIYKSPNFTDGEILGYAPVQQGVNTNVKVTIDTARLKLNDQIYTLWARLQADNGVPGLFEWGLHGYAYDDGPMMQNGHEVVAAFSTEAPAAPAAEETAPAVNVVKPVVVTSNQITINGVQDLNAGVITVGPVNATQNGWLVIYKNPNLTSEEIVGYAPVFKGVNTDVKVTIDTARLSQDQVTLWARLQADNGVPGLFEWGLHGYAYDDGPMMQNGQQVITAFGITGL